MGRRPKFIQRLAIVFSWSLSLPHRSRPARDDLPPSCDIDQPGDVDRRQRETTNYNRPTRGSLPRNSRATRGVRQQRLFFRYRQSLNSRSLMISSVSTFEPGGADSCDGKTLIPFFPCSVAGSATTLWGRRPRAESSG